MKQYPTYKDSEIQWIGEMPEHWDVKRLKSFADFINRGNAPSYIDNGKIGVINQATFSSGEFDFSKLRYTEDCDLDATRGKVFKDDVLLASTGGGVLGKTSLVNFSGDYMADSHVTIIRDSEGRFNPKFLYRFLSVNYDLINGILAQGSTNQTELQRKWLEDFKIPFPSLSEQTAIASFLDHKTSEIDQLIAAKEELIAKLEAQRKAIINEAVTGQAYKTGLIPTPNGKEVKFKDSGIEWLGEIPEHWEAVKLKFLTRKIVDGTHFTPTYIESGIPFLRVTDIQSENINLDEVKFISEEEHNELKKRCNPEKGDVLLSKNGTIGITKVIDWDFEFSIFVSLCLIKFGDRLLPEFFSFFFKSNIVDQQIMEGSKTTSVTNLHLEKINELLQILPTIDEQKLIIEYLNRFTKNIEYLVKIENQSIEKLKLYKQSLISEAVTGKIDVRDWQKD